MMMQSLLALLLLVAIVAIIVLCLRLKSSGHSKDDEERFRLLANDIFNENSRRLRDDSERRISELLSPLRENLNDFRKSFVESYNREARERFSLQEQIKMMMSQNDVIRNETRALTSALKGNTRVQGQWGEMILQNILEKSGLRKDQEYALQASTANADGDRLRPDAVLSFPDGRKLVIDSKVSLTAYLRMVDCRDEDQAKALSKMHVASVKNHINELRDKNYQNYVGKERADFVLMFIPNEGAYLAAMQADDALWQYAYDCRVVIVSPTHLLSVVKLVEQAWLADRQNRNAMEIAAEGGKLLDKLSAFLVDMQRISASLGTAQRAYDAAMAKLNGRGGVLSRAEKLQQLGAKASKKIPSSESSTIESL
ncbi:MAG: DNA recombination protein RmuC [Clostridium sp.]|nr:DNA recombination protein RmuC [Clostridium sp.]